MNNTFLIKEIWSKIDYDQYLDYLRSLGNIKTVEFNQRLVTTEQQMIGIKTPVLRNIAQFIAKGNIESFLSFVRNNYYEETLVEGFVIGFIKDKTLFDKYFNSFIKKIDNWAVCDMCVSSFKIMRKFDFFQLATDLINNGSEFIQRVGLIIILDYYINDKYIDKILNVIECLKSDCYYVNMASAWLLSTCFVKYRENTLELIKRRNLPVFVQNKTIQKIRESYRVDKEVKDELLIYKIKNN